MVVFLTFGCGIQQGPEKKVVKADAYVAGDYLSHTCNVIW